MLTLFLTLTKTCFREENIEPAVYYLMLIITASRAIMYPKSGTPLNLLAILAWGITGELPPPDHLIRLRNAPEGLSPHIRRFDLHYFDMVSLIYALKFIA